MPKKLRKQLQEALAGSAGNEVAYYAAVVADPQTEIERLATAFLNDYQILEIERSTAKKHTLLYLGFKPDRELYPLTGRPENFSQLAEADGVAIQSPEQAGNFVDVYLRVTATDRELFYRVDSVDEVLFRPNLEAEEARQKADFIETYRAVIRPAEVDAAGQGYRVTLYAVREQELERHEIRVGQGGEIGHEVAVLKKGLPLVYGGRV